MSLDLNTGHTIITIDRRRYRVESANVVTLPAPHIFETRQVRVKLDDEHTLSIVWGSCTYSDNHDHGLSSTAFTDAPAEVEIAVLTAEGMLRFSDEDTVAGYVPIGRVADLIDTWPAALTSRVVDLDLVVPR